MKILGINGSGRANGNSRKVLELCAEQLGEDIAFEMVDLAQCKFSGCTGCEGCAQTNRCILQDDMQKIYPLIDEADGLILVSPTYFYNISSNMKAFIERMYPYEVFDPDDRHIWMSVTEGKGLKYALVVGICEQASEKDVGFTIEAMTLPLQSLGYRVVEEVKVLHAFGRDDLNKQKDSMMQIQEGARKLAGTIKLKETL